MRHRGHRFATRADTEVIVAPLRGARPSLRRAAERDVRFRALGRAAAASSSSHATDSARSRSTTPTIGPSLLFGSELKSLLAAPELPDGARPRTPVAVSRARVRPHPAVDLRGCPQAARPATCCAGATGGRRDRALLGPPFRPEPSGAIDADEYAEELRARLREAVRRRLMSDVPLGAFLSGGIDSSSVVAMMVEQLPSRAGEDLLDRLRRAELRRVRRTRAGWPSTSAPITTRRSSRPGSMLDVLPTVVDVLDEPFADASILPTYLLSRFTRESVTVALGGDGSDELLAGYPTFPAERVARLLPRCRTAPPRACSCAARRPAARLDRELQPRLQGQALPPRARPSRPMSAIATWLGSFTPDEQRALLEREPPPIRSREQRRVLRRRRRARSRLERLIYLYATTYLQDDILVKVDRASMACSLEVRAPFLDVELVEFLGRVPAAPQAASLRDEAPAEAGDGATCCRRGSRAGRRRASASRSPPGSRRSCASRCRTSCRRRG